MKTLSSFAWSSGKLSIISLIISEDWEISSPIICFKRTVFSTNFFTSGGTFTFNCFIPFLNRSNLQNFSKLGGCNHCRVWCSALDHSKTRSAKVAVENQHKISMRFLFPSIYVPFIAKKKNAGPDNYYGDPGAQGTRIRWFFAIAPKQYILLHIYILWCILIANNRCIRKTI